VGEDAQGDAHVGSVYDGRTPTGRVVRKDNREASVPAFFQVINVIASRQAAGECVKPTGNSREAAA
jgi:hypothetical protein